MYFSESKRCYFLFHTVKSVLYTVVRTHDSMIGQSLSNKASKFVQIKRTATVIAFTGVNQ